MRTEHTREARLVFIAQNFPEAIKDRNIITNTKMIEEITQKMIDAGMYKCKSHTINTYNSVIRQIQQLQGMVIKKTWRGK